MKTLIGALVLSLWAASAAAQDCPIKHPALTALDHASMAAAYDASFRGVYGRASTGQPGAGVDDREYWIRVSDHYGEFSDGVCRAGWSGYWEAKLIGTDSVSPALGDRLALFQPASAPALPPQPPPIATPPPAPLPSRDLTPIVLRLELLEQKVDDLRASLGQLHEDVLGVRASLDQFHEEVRATWKQVAKTVTKWAAAIVPALVAGRMSK